MVHEDSGAGTDTISAPPPPRQEKVAVLRPPLPPGTTFVTIVRGPGVTAPTSYPITGDVTVIGRHPDCDIVLDDMTVSRWHAELRRDGDALTVTDLDSLNGTYLNHTPVDTAPLNDGDKLWIGTYRLQFRTSPASRRPADHPARRAAGYP